MKNNNERADYTLPSVVAWSHNESALEDVCPSLRVQSGIALGRLLCIGVFEEGWDYVRREFYSANGLSLWEDQELSLAAVNISFLSITGFWFGRFKEGFGAMSYLPYDISGSDDLHPEEQSYKKSMSVDDRVADFFGDDFKEFVTGASVDGGIKVSMGFEVASDFCVAKLAADPSIYNEVKKLAFSKAFVHGRKVHEKLAFNQLLGSL